MVKVGLEAGFGFGLQKPCFLQKCWLPGRLWLPSLQKLLASASASLNAVFDGFGLGFAFVMFFTVGFDYGFSFPEFSFWLPWFNRRFDKTFIHKLCFDFYLPAGNPFSPPSARRASRRNLCLLSSHLEHPAAADAANSSARHWCAGAIGHAIVHCHAMLEK